MADSGGGSTSQKDKTRAGRIIGIAVGCAAGFAIISSLIYFWSKRGPSGHTKVYRDSPKK